ncbi:MAG TPA: hypothetical protein VFI27_20070, partial [candidate division Zixibacteria bacterium]|nr:hypothetical protein [candidate division Zixibacteria bacterium]
CASLAYRPAPCLADLSSYAQQYMYRILMGDSGDLRLCRFRLFWFHKYHLCVTWSLDPGDQRPR